MRVITTMKRLVFRPYGLAFLSIGLVTLLTYISHPFIYQENFTLYLAAVIVVAMYGSRGAALLTTLFSVFLVDYLFDRTPLQLNLTLPDFERGFAFTLVSLIVSHLASARKCSITKLTSINSQLAEALAEVKQLRGILPICASCKKIRDAKGEWTDVAAYITDHTDAEFTHGMCQPCLGRLYPEMYPSPALIEP